MLCNEGNDIKAAKAVETLLNDNGVIRFSECGSYNEAKKAIADNKVDAAWIFTTDFSDKLDESVKNFYDKPLIKIIERETTIPLKLAREKLFGVIYKDYSYLIYNDFVYTNLVSEESVYEKTVKEQYDSLQRWDDLVIIEKLDAKSPTNSNTVNYLTAPLRGILSLMVVLCSLTAALCFLKEQAQGRYSWLPANKRIIPAFASCFSASFLSAIAVMITIWISGISRGTANEIISMSLFTLSVTGFCTMLSLLFRSAGKFGAIIPGVIIIMLALSPIFFNIKVLRPVRLMLPTYYYLYSTYDASYYFYSIIYCMIIYAVCFILNAVLSERKYFESSDA